MSDNELISTPADPAPGARDDTPAAESGETSPHRKRVTIVLKAMGTGLMAGVLLLFVGIGIATIVLPALTGSTALTVKTSSMEPALPPGTMVVVRPTKVSEIEPGMVLTYQLKSGEEALVTHRVTQKQFISDGSPVFITQGDANPQPDPTPVQEAQIKGTVWYAVPYIGWVTAAFTGPSKALVTLLVVGALLIYSIWMVSSALRARKRKAAPATEKIR